MHDPLLAGPWSIVTSGVGRFLVLTPVVVAVALVWAFHGAAASSGARARPGRSAP